MTQTVETFFDGGVTAAKFEDRAFGTVIGGRITSEPRMTQQRDYTSGEPIFYTDGNPAMQMVVTVQAFEAVGDDDGQRAFYIKGQMKQAVGEALRKHGAKSPAMGGALWIKYTEDKPTTLKNGRPGNPQKIYIAKYDPPAVGAANDFYAEPAAAAPASAPPAAYAPPATQACPPGIDPSRWAAMDDAQRRQLLDALGSPAAAAPASTPHGGAAFRDEPPF